MITRSEPLAGAGLDALLAAIKSSPIVVRLAARLFPAKHFQDEHWARVRKSPDVDAFVLAWIASHVRVGRRTPRMFT